MKTIYFLNAHHLGWSSWPHWPPGPPWTPEHSNHPCHSDHLDHLDHLDYLDHLNHQEHLDHLDRLDRLDQLFSTFLSGHLIIYFQRAYHQGWSSLLHGPPLRPASPASPERPGPLIPPWPSNIKWRYQNFDQNLYQDFFGEQIFWNWKRDFFRFTYF